MNKRILAGLAGLALAGSAMVPALAHSKGDHYQNNCGQSSGHAANETTVYPDGEPDLENGGAAGVKGSNGYIEAEGEPGPPPSGGIDGSTRNQEFYGSVGDDGVCAGSDLVSDDVLIDVNL